MASKKPRRGRPPGDPKARRDRVVAVRFTAEEWGWLRFEMDYAAQVGGKIVSPSTVIRKAWRHYNFRRDLRSDYPPPKMRRKVRRGELLPDPT